MKHMTADTATRASIEAAIEKAFEVYFRNKGERK